MDLIYCASGNNRFTQIALEYGFRYGTQLPGTVNAPLFFADHNFKQPDRARYMAALSKHKPVMATVLDWEKEDQLSEVLKWAEEAAQYTDTIVIVPKVINGVERLPREIGGKPVRLGYSVPTAYGATSVPAWEFYGWPIHLLGGSPQGQIRLARYLNVKSADGNYVMKLATKYNRFWVNGTSNSRAGRWQQSLSEVEDYRDLDAPYEAFRRSCENIIAAWIKVAP